MTSNCTPHPVHGLWPSVLELRTTLIGISPPIWRLIQVPVTHDFFALHSAIQDAVGWGSHCNYRFEHFTRRPGKASIGLPLSDSVPSYEHDCLISPYFVNDGDTALYSADRYDSRWRFQVLLEKTVFVDEGVSYPQCVGGEGGCPPLGIGYEAFQNHLNVSTDQNNPMQLERISFLTSMGYSDQFNPNSVVFKDPKERFRMHYGP